MSVPTTLQTLATNSPQMSLFQHRDVEQSYQVTSGTTKIAEAELWTRRDILIQAHQAWKQRIDQVTELVNGDWYRVWPDLTREPSAPTVANTIEMAISHFAAIGGAIVPSVKVPVPHNEAGPEGSRGAAKRERRVRELEGRSNIENLLSLWYGDYSGAGANAAFVWVDDFSLPPEDRNPIIHRVDPRHYYPVTDAQGMLTEVLVARRVHAYEAVREYPELATVVNIDDSDLEEWFWFTPDRLLHMIADVGPAGRKTKTGFVITDVVNPLGVIPMVELKRPTFDGERRGVHDQTIHIMRVQHQLMNLTIEKTEEDVYPAIGYYDVEGVERFGPGSVHKYRSMDTKIETIQTQAQFDVKDHISRLEEQARMQSVYPRQLTGDPGASIASGRAIGAAQGALDARLALAHRQFEWFLEHVSSLVLRVDEHFCDGTKTIYGDPHDRKRPESFVPSRDIAGNYEVTRSYGLGAGSDPTNRETRLQMHLAAGLISRARSREELDFLEDPLDEEKSISKEAMIDAINQGMLAAAAQGDKDSALRYFVLLNDPNLTMEEVLVKLFEEEQEAAQAAAQAQAGGAPAPGGASPLDVAADAEGAARGGVPAGAALPGLPAIMGAEAPKQVL